MSRYVNSRCVASLTFAPAASAATWDHVLHTGDPGGVIRFKADGDYVEVCDIEADGYAAFGTVVDGGHDYTLRAGGNGNCSIVSAATPGHDLDEDQKVYFEICLKKGLGVEYCDTERWWNG